jgi:hypothetical protein
MAAQVTPKDTATETPKGAWKVTFLLFLFMLVNFADKIVVGLAGGPIMDELKINPQQFGDLGSSFFYLFSISSIIVKNCWKPRAFSHAAAYLKRNRAITVTTYLADLARQMTQVPKGAAYKTSVFPTFPARHAAGRGRSTRRARRADAGRVNA